MAIDLQKQTSFEGQFTTWFDAGLKDKLDDSRRRYRMELEDAADRLDLGLSALPSTKSTMVVDTAVDRALMDYHADSDSLSYQSKNNADVLQETFAQWLTKTVKYRMDHTFPFFSWHTASLTAAFADGLEAAMVYWKKESYKEKKKAYTDVETGQQVSEQAFKLGSSVVPERFMEDNVEEEVVVSDTWWIDQLRPGEELLWDYKIPYLDINLGQVCLVKLSKTVDEILQLSDSGIFKKIKREELAGYRKSVANSLQFDSTTTVANPDNHSLGEYDRVELWLFFEKINNQWFCSPSIEGQVALANEPLSVNELFFAGRKVNKLPIVLGATKIKLWETVGRSLPETIAPIEDEWTDHRNNLNDAAKMAVQGKWRVDPTSDVYINDILNARVFKAHAGDVESMQMNYGLLENSKASESLTSDMNELIPVSMSSRVVVPKGTDKTLGAVQMSQQNSQDKLSVQLMVRNETFMKPLMWLIAQLEFGYESDETILKIAGTQAGIDMNQPPFTTLIDGKPGIDLSIFDFDITVQINAGLGSAPRMQKINNLMQIMTTAKALGVPTDNLEIFKQVTVVAGYQPEQFLPKAPPPPPAPSAEYKLDLKASWQEIMAFAPELIQDLIEKYKMGMVDVNTKIDDSAMNEQMHNGNPNTASTPTPDMTQGSAAQGMSEGGQK